MPERFWQITSNGIPMLDDFALTPNKGHLIVSDDLLQILRQAGMTCAESDEIDVPIEEYFGSGRDKFWLQ